MKNGAMISLPQVIFVCLLVLGSGMPSIGEDTEEDRIHRAIEREDLAAVKRLIAEGVDLNPVDIDSTYPPLKTAVDRGNLEIVRLLLANGADPNGIVIEGPMVDIPIFFYVLNRGDEVILDLFIERGVRKKYFRDYLRYSLGSGRNLRGARIILDRGLAHIDTSQPFLLRYAYGTPDVRALISDNNSDIAEGRATLLNEMIKHGGISISGIEHDPEFKYPLATTFLGDKRDPFRYSCEKAFDANLETSWVEGVKGDGIGEKVAFTPFDFIRGTEIESITVVPGYAVEKHFRRNNRVKQAVLSVYPTGVYCPQGQTSYFIGKMIFQKILAFNDDMRFQKFPLQIPGYEENMVLAGGVLLVLEIKEVYPGSDWDDTCIAEIKLTDREGRQIPIISKNP